VTVLADLWDFVSRHQWHGRSDADATEPTATGYLITVTCSCRVVLERWVTPQEAEEDLLPPN
jgi:hypothetical protein